MLPPPPQQVSLQIPISQSTLAPLLNDKKLNCAIENTHSEKRPAIAPPAQCEQGVRLNISSKQHNDDTVINSKITHADICKNNNKYTNAHIIGSINKDNC